ncbi:hypothetical protein PF005_g30118 [Phytophthora fragariae]|uniref:RxLR effector protein n=1 Tax=Phytophthora fragariae TaxID=53985 RepID=A0A6A3DMF5_9STRA|nr:hypothetical protein PF003_g24633 [Phytophthora fragariae]KAE8919218.1 hypothetical protein PF009_g30471 [Phytophthora fragariae]KAE8962696.1 hypothetical protein PF011_g29288 [Phytophthora fragariae]KAE9062414.1 hypothetical protein PF007_g29922 [Phytophthora fragariae]KAE9068253.1 hypothetical protein PF006_g29832 [Phytophthora fragariae]
MRVHCVFLAIAATLVAVTDATFTSSALEKASVAKLVLPDGAQAAQTAPTRFLRKRAAKEESEEEERVGDLNLLTFLPKFVKQVEGKSNAQMLHHLQQLKFSDKQREAFLMLYHAHLQKLAKAAAHN